MPVTIREATMGDLAAMLALEQASATAAHWSAGQYGTRLAERLALVGESDGRVVGFLCWREAGGEWEIENVVVGAESQQQGIGAALVRTAIEKWRASGGIALLLEVRESNESARKLYEKCGLREFAKRRAYYSDPREDAVLYSLVSGS